MPDPIIFNVSIKCSEPLKNREPKDFFKRKGGCHPNGLQLCGQLGTIRITAPSNDYQGEQEYLLNSDDLIERYFDLKATQFFSPIEVHGNWIFPIPSFLEKVSITADQDFKVLSGDVSPQAPQSHQFKSFAAGKVFSFTKYVDDYKEWSHKINDIRFNTTTVFHVLSGTMSNYDLVENDEKAFQDAQIVTLQNMPRRKNCLSVYARYHLDNKTPLIEGQKHSYKNIHCHYKAFPDGSRLTKTLLRYRVPHVARYIQDKSLVAMTSFPIETPQEELPTPNAEPTMIPISLDLANAISAMVYAYKILKPAVNPLKRANEEAGNCIAKRTRVDFEQATPSFLSSDESDDDDFSFLPIELEDISPEALEKEFNLDELFPG